MPTSSPNTPPDMIAGVVERIIFLNEENLIPPRRSAGKRAEPITTYTANRLVSASKSGYTVLFYYDAEGRLLKVNRNGTIEHRYYDGPQCFFRCRPDGTWVDFTIWGPTPDEAISRWDAAHGGWAFFHRDPINSPDTATDLGGSVVERYRYDPFGLPYIYDAAWNSRTSSALYNPWLFTGQEWMADLGLCNYKNRFYSPKLGRFLQNDPIRFDGGDLNLYRYCGNEPIGRNDPTGLLEEKGGFLYGPEKFQNAKAAFKEAIVEKTGGNLEDASADALAHAIAKELKLPEGVSLGDANDTRSEAIKAGNEKKATDAEKKMEKIADKVEQRVRENAKADPKLKEHIEKYDDAKKKAAAAPKPKEPARVPLNKEEKK